MTADGVCHRFFIGIWLVFEQVRAKSAYRRFLRIQEGFGQGNQAIDIKCLDLLAKERSQAARQCRLNHCLKR